MTPHVRNHSRGEVAVQIRQMRFQILEALALREIVGKFVQVAHPVRPILPIGESGVVHAGQRVNFAGKIKAAAHVSAGLEDQAEREGEGE